MALPLFCFISTWQKNRLLWESREECEALSTVWDKSTIPCENGSHSNLWIGSSLHWFKLWLVEQNKRPVSGTGAEAHQTRPNWTGAGLAWWYNRARNYQGLFQLAWYGLVLCYYTVLQCKIAGGEDGERRSRSGANNRTNSQMQCLSAKSLWFSHYVHIVSLWNFTFYSALIKQPFYVHPKWKLIENTDACNWQIMGVTLGGKTFW